MAEGQEPIGFTIDAAGPFSLAASIRFLEGFTPAAYREGTADWRLDLAFPVDGDWRTVGVTVHQAGDGTVAGEFVGDAGREAVRDQVTRILSLDVDGRGFPLLAERDPVVRRLQERYPGLRPVTFWSPYEAAAWTVIGHRIRIAQAAALKASMAEQLGEQVELRGRRLTAFPAPARLAELDGFPGLFGRKAEWLRGVAAAALDGHLDAARLRSLPRERALAELEALPGIGPFAAALILLRGAGHPDHFPQDERRLRRAMARAYGLGESPPPERLRAIADRWRPYRTWVSLLLRTELEDDTHEISGPPARPRRDTGP
jgi:DNA-3-methyladenine glycosylase II